MPVLVVTPEFPPTSGGIATNAFDLARHWSEREAVVVVTRALPERRDTAALGLRIEEVPAHGRVRGALATRALIRRLVLETEFDVIYSTHWRACGAPTRAALHGMPDAPPLVQAVHGSELLYLLSRRAAVHRALFDWTASGVELFAGQGSYQVGLLGRLGIKTDKIVTGTNGVEPDRFKPALPESVEALRKRHDLVGKRVLMTVGRLVERKGFDTVIKAMPEITRSVPDAVYVIKMAGPEPYAADLRRLVAASGMPPDSVRFIGPAVMDDLTSYFALADVFVMPNRIVDADVEGFGLVFIEAALCGKPAIGGRSGGAVDAIVDGLTGRLVDPSSVSEVAAAGIELLSQPGLARQMGAAGRQRALAEFDYRIVAPRLRAALPSRGVSAIASRTSG